MSHDLRIERVIDASPQQVFAAFTDPDAMTQWWEVDPGWTVEVRSHDLRAGGTTSLVFGEPSAPCHERLTYTEVAPPHRLRYLDEFTGPEGTTVSTDVTVSFEARGSTTLMTIVQTGFPTATRRDRHDAGWPRFLDRLEIVLEARRMP